MRSSSRTPSANSSPDEQAPDGPADGMAHVQIAFRPPGYVLVRVHGEVDLNTRIPLVEAVDQVDAHAPVVVDLHAVHFFSLGGLDWLEATVSALTARGRRVRVVCRDRGPVWRLIRPLRLDGHWSLQHEVSDPADCLDLARPVPAPSPGAAGGRLQGRPEPDSICPLDEACAVAVELRSETSPGAVRHL